MADSPADVGAPLRAALECPPGTSVVPAVDVAFEGAACARPDGVLHGPMAAWWQDGSRERAGSWVDGAQDGQWTWWDREGRVNSQGLFRGGLRVGKWQGWNLGFLVSEGSYDDQGQKVGLWQEWFPQADGQLWTRRTYQAGQAVGAWEMWRPDGTPHVVGQLVDGLFDGDWREFHPDGSPSVQGQYRSDKRVGAWTWWAEDGSVRHTCDFGPDGSLNPECEPPSP